MIRLFNTFSQNKIMLSVFMLFFFCSFAGAQVTGPTAVDTHSTHRYYYDDGISYAFNNWVISGPVTSSIKGNTGTNYYVDVEWAGVGTGSVTFRKKTIVLSTLANIVISVPAPTSGPSPDQNYIHTKTPKIATTNVSTLSNADKIESIAYFDGLGRAMQSVGIRAGGNGEDVITHVAYDEYGRQAKDYLPYTASSTDGSFRTNGLSATNTYYDATKYEADFPSVAVNDINAYSQKEFEASPLNRVLKQAAPGKDWKLGNGHEIEFNYQTNHSTEVRFYDVSLAFANNTYTPTLQGGTSYYSAGTLYKTVTKDENHDGTSTKNHTTEEFKDKQGRVILKRTYNSSVAHDTYYVYDEFGNLSYVLPPKAEPQTAKPDATELSELCYQYKYDHRSRLVEKKIPGKGWEYIVYNRLDQPIMTQDTNLKNQSKWLFTKYDVFGRVAYTGLVNHSSNRISWQGWANGVGEQHVTKSNTSITIAGTTIYYNNGAYPTNISEIYTINYYDNYTFDKISGNSETAYGVTPETNVKGLATGSKVRVLGTSDWITTVSYYDDKSRPIYVYSFNDYLNTTDKVKSKLDFTGAVDETTTTHAKTGQSTITTIDYFIYDDAGRLVTQKQKINSLAEETIVQNNYDDLGQLISKGVGGKTTQGRLQNVDYTYNIRGWLKQINNPTTLGSDLFSFKLNYNTNDHGGANLFNGNIAETEWKTANTNNSLKWYKYTYDDLNRITSGIDNTTNQDYKLQSIAYDKNGNITSLIRRGHTVANPVAGTSSHFGTMDNLVYTYETNSNRLKKVLDNGNDTYGFKDGSNITTEYTYDANGNMLRDYNKGISSNITYNHLNLPTLVTLSGGNISYIYDATGVKLKKIVSNGGATTEYAGNYVYEGGSLKFFNHAEGYVDVNGSSYSYVYQYKDHLGNVRLSYKDSNNNGSVTTSEILEENNYYPFGLKHKGYNAVVNSSNVALKYKYNGKEFNNELGYNVYDYQARHYDPAIGKWLQIDPLAQEISSWSQYNYAFDNPIRYIDPDGRAPFDITLLGENNSSITIKTDLIDVSVDASGLVGDLGGNYTFEGDDILVAGLDIVGTLDPTPVSDALAAGIEFNNGNIVGGILSGLGMLSYIGDLAKVGKIPKHVKTIKKAIQSVKKGKRSNKVDIPKTRRGKGTVDPSKRDPKRAYTKKEKREMLEEQGGKCAKCKKDKKVDEVDGHHIDRHADGGRTTKENGASVCKKCHKELHSKGS